MQSSVLCLHTGRKHSACSKPSTENLGAQRGEASFSQRIRPRRDATSRIGHCLQGEAVEDLAHVFARCLPDSEQHALTLVIARAVLMRLAEVAQGDRTIDGAEDFADTNLRGWASEPTPRLERTRPAPFSASRICSRYGCGSAVRSAMSRTEVGTVCSSCKASESSARHA